MKTNLIKLFTTKQVAKFTGCSQIKITEMCRNLEIIPTGLSKIKSPTYQLTLEDIGRILLHSSIRIPKIIRVQTVFEIYESKINKI